MWTQHKNTKSQRIQVLVDCICGAICALSAIIGIFFFSQPDNPYYVYFYAGGLIFWFGYLIFALFIVGLGIYTYVREKGPKSDKNSKEKLKVPIV